ncbi:MAG: hypothetical protein AB1410_08375 [Acidobacteriota bacterium]
MRTLKHSKEQGQRRKIFSKSFFGSFGKKNLGQLADLYFSMVCELLKSLLIVLERGNSRIQILTFFGECIKIYPAPAILSISSRIWFTKSGTYYYNTEGYLSDSLILHRTLEGKELVRYGKIFGEKFSVYNFETKLIKKGEIPDRYKNQVFPVADLDGSVYCIHSALPIVKKFSSNGDLILEKNLDLPEFKQIFSNWIKANRDAPPYMSFSLSYWKDIEISENGDLFLLVNLSERMIIYRMDKNGNISARYIGVQDSITMIDVKGRNLWAFGGNSHKFYHFIL